MSTFIMSGEYPIFVNELIKLGHTVILSETIKTLEKPIQNHSDIQAVVINDKLFLLDECKTLQKELSKYNPIICSKKIGKKYPENILLNVLYIDNKLYGKSNYIEPKLKEYCKENKIEIVNINQGYAKCSTAIVGKSFAITADTTIYNAQKNNGADVLNISEGNIILNGYNYGFIGGASAMIDDKTLAFFGNVEKHPDYESIKNFCNHKNINICIIAKDEPLTDIGGIVKISHIKKCD